MENPMSSFGSEAETTVPRKNLKKLKIHLLFFLRYAILKEKQCFNADDYCYPVP